METEKMVCINTDDYYLGTLTYGKVYDAIWNETIVYSSDGIYLEITNDIGVKIEYHESKFMKLNEWRNLKLNDLLK